MFSVRENIPLIILCFWMFVGWLARYDGEGAYPPIPGSGKAVNATVCFGHSYEYFLVSIDQSHTSAHFTVY